MSDRILRLSSFLWVLGFLVSCATRPTLDGIDAWLSRWETTRACLVHPAEDVATGLSLSRLSKSSCAIPAALLEEPSGPAALDDVWRAAISELRRFDPAARPSVQAAVLARIDHAVSILALARGRLPIAAPQATPLEMIPEVHPPGISSSSEPAAWSYPDPDEYGAEWFAERGRDRVVLAFDGYHGLEGLVVHSSHDAGATWRSEHLPYGHHRGSWVDPKGGRTWRYLRRFDRDTLERIDVSGTINVYPARHSWRPAQRCHASRRWRLLDNELMVEGEPAYIKLPPASDLVACDRAGAIVVTGQEVLRCDRTCLRVFTRPSAPGSATLLPDGRWMYVATLEGVAAAWVEGVDRPVIVRLPDATDEIVTLEIVDGSPMLLLGWTHNRVLAFPRPR